MILIKQNCYYCGIEPRQKMKLSKNGECIYNGIDRVDNNIGYTTENCVTCCQVCNGMKSVLSQEEFINHIKRIINIWEGKRNETN